MKKNYKQLANEHCNEMVYGPVTRSHILVLGFANSLDYLEQKETQKEPEKPEEKEIHGATMIVRFEKCGQHYCNGCFKFCPNDHDKGETYI